MAAERVEELDAQPLEDLLERVDQIDSVPGLQSYLGWAVRYGVTSLWGCDVESDPGDPKRYVFFVAQDGLGLPDESYYREETHAETLVEYEAHVARTLALAGLGHAEEQAKAVVALEKEIAACHWDRVRTRDLRQMYNPQTVGELTTDSPDFGWELILDGASVTTVDEVVNCQPSFFVEVAPLLTEDRLPQWRSWARFHAISGTQPVPVDPFRQRAFRVLRAHAAGHPAAARALEARRRPHRAGAGRGDRQDVRGAPLHDRRQGAHGRSRGEPHRGVPAVDHRPRPG